MLLYEIKIRFKNIARLNIKIKNKKYGFTLIELVAVIAIIIILSGALLPKVLGYVQEAKKLKVVDQCRKVVMATESYNLRYSPLNTSESIKNIIEKNGVDKYLDREEFKNIDIDNTTIKNCYDIVNGAEFDFNEQSEILNCSSIEITH